MLEEGVEVQEVHRDEEGEEGRGEEEVDQGEGDFKAIIYQPRL